MDEMIERVMAAMKEANYKEGLTLQQERRHIARAAIEAMREPQMKQCVAGAHAADIRPSEAKAVFNAMIDAALATPPAEG